jgi:hypothetical protein
MNRKNENSSDQRSEPMRTAFLVDPARGSVMPVRLSDYESIRALFPENAHLEGNTICHIEGDLYLSSWADCEQFLVAPAWRTSFNSKMAFHGLTVVDAYDISTGESVDIPFCSDCFAKSITSEDFENRREPHRPNKEWALQGGYEWSFSAWSLEDGTGTILSKGSAWEDAGR